MSEESKITLVFDTDTEPNAILYANAAHLANYTRNLMDGDASEAIPSLIIAASFISLMAKPTGYRGRYTKEEFMRICEEAYIKGIELHKKVQRALIDTPTA